MNREVGPTCRRGRAVEQPDHRSLEDERRQIERDDLRCLLSEESRLQIHPRANARVAQLAGLVERGDTEMTATFIDQSACDGHGAMPVSVGFYHDHQLAVRRDRAQRAKVRAQRAEIDLGDGRALRFDCHGTLNFQLRAHGRKQSRVTPCGYGLPVHSHQVCENAIIAAHEHRHRDGR